MVNDASTVSAPSNVTCTGYTLYGWYSAGVNEEWDFDSDTVQGNIKPTAHWAPITYTVHYDGNGATGGNMEDETFTYDRMGYLYSNQFT